MGMDGIGGVGALNVSSQTRVTRPQSETVDVNTGSTAGQQQVQAATLPPVLEKAVVAIIIASRASSRIVVRYRRIRKLHRTRSRQRSMI